MVQTPEEKAASYRLRWETRRKNGTDRGYKISDTTKYRTANKKKWEDGVYKDKTLWQKGSKHTPETIEKMRETKRRHWEEGVYADKKPATRRRTSKMELSLKPYLKKLGYRHNTGEEIESFIRCEDKTRLPDFIDIEGRRVFEFFGDFWHRPEEEAVVIAAYAAKNWECTILWEHDLPAWLEDHRTLVTPLQHAVALTTCRVRSKL